MAYSVFDKYPSGANEGSSVIVVAPPAISLAAASDSGVKGDQTTTLKNVRLEVGATKSGTFSWMSGDGNSSFDAAVDTPVIAGGVNVSLVAGYNTFRFFSLDLASGTTSLPAYFPVYLDPMAALQQENKLDETLNKVVLAYLGRPLTNSEYTVLRSTLDMANGDPKSLIQTLVGNTEVHAVYTVPDFVAGIDRCYNTLFGRAVTSQETAYWSGLVTQGVLAEWELPYKIAESAGAEDLGVLSARILFMQQANAKYVDNLALAGVSERTLLEVERTSVQGIKSIADIGKTYESLVANAKNLLTNTQALPAPTVALDANSDTGTKGDFETSLGSIKVNVSGTTPGALAWLDSNFNGKFDPASDGAVVNGAVYATLNTGPNTLTFYQMVNGSVSQASYLTLRRADPNTPTDPPSAPVLDLRTDDDDGVDNADNVTTKSLVRIDVSNLDPNASFAWLEKDGNGVYNPGKDIVLQTGSSTASASVQLQEAGIGSNLTGLSAYQVRAGLRSQEGALSVTYLKSIDVVKIISGATVGGASGVVTLQFDRPIDWARLDANHDGRLQMGAPGSGAELGISMGGAPEIQFNNGPADWSIDVPVYSGVFLTINNVDWSYAAKPNTNPVESYTSGSLLIVLTGVPDVTNQVTSDVWFSIGS